MKNSGKDHQWVNLICNRWLCNFRVEESGHCHLPPLINLSITVTKCAASRQWVISTYKKYRRQRNKLTDTTGTQPGQSGVRSIPRNNRHGFLSKSMA